MPGRTELDAKRETVLAVAAHHGARNVRVFGSVARKDASPESDIDLLVTLDGDRSLLDHVALQQDLEDVLGCRVDVVTEGSLHPALRPRVLADAVPI